MDSQWRLIDPVTKLVRFREWERQQDLAKREFQELRAMMYDALVDKNLADDR